MKILIIEDEAPAARRLERLILSLRPEVEMIGHLDSIEDAVSSFTAGSAPDLIFMDIQLADGLSFEIFNRCTVPAPVIFTTAFDHYAIRAFKVNSIDYLLKPVDENELDAALQKFESLHKDLPPQNNELQEIIRNLKKIDKPWRQRFLVKNGGRLLFVPVTEIAYLFSDEGMTFIVTRQNDRYLLESTLEEAEQELDPSQYFRINRKMILCLNCITRIEPHLNNRLLLEIQPSFGEDVFVSRQRTAEFKAWLDQ